MIKKLTLRIFDALVASFAPVVAMKNADGTWKRRLVVAIHISFVALVLGAMITAQFHFKLEAYVRSSLPFVRAFWLPLVAILAYATVWSAWFVARTLRQPEDRPLFDSVSTALRDGLDRFTRAGIDPSKTPLYLVLGAPSGGIRSFFASSHIDLAVLPSAEEADEPIQVCGNRDAIYVCCRDASLTGHFARESAKSLQMTAAQRSIRGQQNKKQWTDGRLNPAWRNGAACTSMSPNTANIPPAHHASEKSAAVNTIDTRSSAVATLSTTVSSVAKTTPSVDSTVQRIESALGAIETLTADQEFTQTASKPTLLQPRQTRPQEMRLDAGDAEKLLERLQTLCQEVVALREPYCPMNGIIAMIPLPACDSVEVSDHIGMRLERDLMTIASSTETHLSMQVVFCDLDLCEGSQSFLDRFPETQRHRRLGAIIPAVPGSEAESIASILDKAVQWICHDLFPPLGFRLMHRDLKDTINDRELCMGNHRIERLVQQMRDRSDGMSRLLRRSVAGLGGKLRIRGCFIAATGLAGHTSKQAFCEGVVPLIIDMQNEVQWSRMRREQDRWQRTLAIGTYLLVAIATAFVVMLIITTKSN